MTFNGYIESVRLKAFSWGDHDCITFANKACAMQQGKGFADEFLGKYSTRKGALLTYQRWLKTTDYNNLIDGVDDRLQRLKTTIPPIGSIVSEKENDVGSGVLPMRFGVCLGRWIAFVGDDGFVWSPPTNQMIFWGVRNG